MDGVENVNGKLVWSALEYEDRERSRDWFYALLVIVITGSLASILLGNYFFAALILISGIMLGFFAIKKPDMLTYELNSRGLKILDRLYPYDNMQAFWVQTSDSHRTDENAVMKPLLFIRTSRVFAPIISIPIEDEYAEEIYNFLVDKNVPVEEMVEHPSERIMEFLGF